MWGPGEACLAPTQVAWRSASSVHQIVPQIRPITFSGATSQSQEADMPWAKRHPYPLKIPSGMQAETIQFGASTVSLILRSMATEQRTSAS